MTLSMFSGKDPSSLNLPMKRLKIAVSRGWAALIMSKYRHQTVYRLIETQAKINSTNVALVGLNSNYFKQLAYASSPPKTELRRVY